MCRKKTKFMDNYPLKEVLETSFTEEYESARARHTPEGWIAERRKEDATLLLLDTTFEPEESVRLLRRMDRLLWSKNILKDNDLHEFASIGDEVWITVTSKDSLACLPGEGKTLKVQRRERVFTVYMWNDSFFHSTWDEDS